MKRIISIVIALTAICGSASAQKKVTVSGGAAIVSSYIWRGSYNAGASFQPEIEGQLAGFALGAWGSVDFVGQQCKEVDLYLNYTIKGVTIGVADYWWEGEEVYKYLDYAKGSTAHRWEANVSYQLPVEKFPLSISWNTIFAGRDYNVQGDRAYSTYIELDYPFMAGSVDMNATVGAAPWGSPSFLTSNNAGFSVCNVAIAASKSIKLPSGITMPIFSRLILNPATEDIHIVFGVSFNFGS